MSHADSIPPQRGRRFLRFRPAAPPDAEGRPIHQGAVVKIRAGEFAGFYGIVAGWVNGEVAVDLPGVGPLDDVVIYRTETCKSGELELRS